MALLVISCYAGQRPGIIISSLIWVLIGFELYREYDQVLMLALVYMIAFAQVFVPINIKKAGGARCSSGRVC